MDLAIFLIGTVIFTVLTIKCLKNEEALIDLEDKIIADIKDFIRNGREARKEARIAARRSERAASARIVYRNDSAQNRAA